MVSVSQEVVALMQSSVVAASVGCIRNAVALRDPCALTLSSGAPDALGLLGLLIKEKFQRLRLETKSLKLSQGSAILRTCSLQEVAASWLRPMLLQGQIWSLMLSPIVVYDLKLATDDRRDKKFLLTSKLCPFGVVSSCPGVIYMY